MTSVRTRSWAELTGSSQAAFLYAFGARARLFFRTETKSETEARAPFVSTSTLLLGIARTHAGPNEDNPLRDLLARYGRSVADLEAMLRSRMQGHTPFDLDAKREPLRDFPELTANVASALDAAGELAVKVPSAPKRLPLRFLFGGLLKTSRSRAFETLAMTLGSEADLAKIANDYQAFLEQGPTARYADFLGPPPNLRDGFQLLPRVIDDAPTLQDQLGFQPLVDSLDGLLNSNRSPLPLAIAITARWGRGKTSVMRQLRARLRRRPAHGAKKRRAGTDGRAPGLERPGDDGPEGSERGRDGSANRRGTRCGSRRGSTKGPNDCGLRSLKRSTVSRSGRCVYVPDWPSSCDSNSVEGEGSGGWRAVWACPWLPRSGSVSLSPGSVRFSRRPTNRPGPWV